MTRRWPCPRPSGSSRNSRARPACRKAWAPWRRESSGPRCSRERSGATRAYQALGGNPRRSSRDRTRENGPAAPASPWGSGRRSGGPAEPACTPGLRPGPAHPGSSSFLLFPLSLQAGPAGAPLEVPTHLRVADTQFWDAWRSSRALPPHSKIGGKGLSHRTGPRTCAHLGYVNFNSKAV